MCPESKDCRRLSVFEEKDCALKRSAPAQARNEQGGGGVYWERAKGQRRGTWFDPEDCRTGEDVDDDDEYTLPQGVGEEQRWVW